MESKQTKTYNLSEESFSKTDIVCDVQLAFNFPVEQVEDKSSYKVLSLFSGCGGMDLG